jgi:enamine deaminase RidA (YjgF/YER057c/UK114 family)
VNNDSVQRYNSKTPWEPIAGYCRALRVGNHIYVSGTTATDERGGIIGIGNHKAQTEQALLNIQRAIEALGGTLADVVRTRIYIVDASKSTEVMQVHGEFFRNILPTTVIVGVSALVIKEMLVEIEAEAILR